MNTISPYTIRFYDPNKKSKTPGQNYYALGAVGQFDIYKELKAYFKSNKGKYFLVPDSDQIYTCAGFGYNDRTREIRGYIRAGSYGTKTDIINIKTGQVAFSKIPETAEVINHFVRFFIPEKLDEGVALLHNYKNIGIKTLLHNILRTHFLALTGRTMQMNPLAYEKAYNEWQKASAREIKLVKFTGMGAAEDQIAKLGHSETEVIIKSGRNKNLGTLVDYFTKGTEQHSTLELLSPLCSQIKTVVEMGGRKRTFRIGVNPNQQVCEIEVDDKSVTITAGNPNGKELDTWCTGLLNDFLASMYPGMKIKV